MCEKESELGRIAEEYKQREKLWVRSERHFISGRGGKSIFFLEGSQAIPARPSDKERITVKTLGW
jgi:hypothetical protein